MCHAGRCARHQAGGDGRVRGATVVLCDQEKTSREAVAEALRAEHGYTMIPPFDHPEAAVGQGTAALEMFEELGRLGRHARKRFLT